MTRRDDPAHVVRDHQAQAQYHAHGPSCRLKLLGRSAQPGRLGESDLSEPSIQHASGVIGCRKLVAEIVGEAQRRRCPSWAHFRTISPVLPNGPLQVSSYCTSRCISRKVECSLKSSDLPYSFLSQYRTVLLDNPFPDYGYQLH